MKLFVAMNENIEQLCTIRSEMLHVVNNLPSNHSFNSEFLNNTRNYFLSSNHLTVLATNSDVVIGCATRCFSSFHTNLHRINF